MNASFMGPIQLGRAIARRLASPAASSRFVLRTAAVRVSSGAPVSSSQTRIARRAARSRWARTASRGAPMSSRTHATTTSR